MAKLLVKAQMSRAAKKCGELICGFLRTDERLHIIPKFLILIAILALAYFSPIILHKTTTAVLADEPTVDPILTAPQPIHTTSRFESKLVTQVDAIPLKTVTKDDPYKELDDDAVVQEG